MDIDNLIADYANRLQSVYNDRTAGVHTFTGILATFLLDVDKSREDGRVALYTDPKGFSEGDWVTVTDTKEPYFGHKGYVNRVANDLTVRKPYSVELETGRFSFYAADQLEPTGKSL